MGFIVALPALAALWMFNKKFKKAKSKKWFSYLVMLIAGCVGVGLVFTFVGAWTAGGVSWGAGMLSKLTGVNLDVAVSLALTLAMLLWAIGDIAYDKKADKGAQFAVIILPTLLALVVGGALGHTGGDAVHSTYNQLQALMSRMGQA
jgi:formate hydrogenlyase subunit 3/multisubunit Na+/H+ antiporter MnhD subunit